MANIKNRSDNQLITRLNQIKSKLYRLIELDSEFSTFGSKEAWGGHEYDLYPTVDHEQLKAFEDKNGIIFPEELRLFVTTIADGGAGPYYGLFSPPLGIQVAFDHGMVDLSMGFPITGRQVSDYINKNKEGAEQEEETPCIQTDEPLTGVAFLSEYGCGGYYLIVLNGEQHGYVWFYRKSCLKPVFTKGKQWSFFDWYENWLDLNLTRISKL
jgi:hypothetical protein